MTPFSIIYVSQIYGDDTNGNGSPDAPYQTLTKGIAEMDAKSISDGTPWQVWALGGMYDETVVGIGNDVYLRLCTGAVLASTTGPCVSDAGGSVFLYIEEKADLYADNGGASPEFSISSNVVKVSGRSPIYVSDIAGIDVSGGEFWADGIMIDGDSNSEELINQSGGVVRLSNCRIRQPYAASAIVKSGGDMKLHNCQIETVHSNYISAPSAQSVQVFGCVSNVAKGANITETVGSMFVDSSFTL